MVQDRIYLLDMAEVTEEGQSSVLYARAQRMADAERLRKVMRMRNGAVQASSLGAGLLLQKAVAERELPAAFFRRFGFRELLEELEERQKEGVPAQLKYDYGEHGKPYLRDIPLQFSLSHSGRFVLCAVSEREIGADIQQMRPVSEFRVAERFFTAREVQNIRQCGEHRLQEREFYRLWTRKEAYGKLTGEGIAAVVGQDMEELEQKLLWEDCPPPEGYQLAVCRYRDI